LSFKLKKIKSKIEWKLDHVLQTNQLKITQTIS
jgi:hypothetical protein